MESYFGRAIRRKIKANNNRKAYHIMMSNKNNKNNENTINDNYNNKPNKDKFSRIMDITDLIRDLKPKKENNLSGRKEKISSIGDYLDQILLHSPHFMSENTPIQEEVDENALEDIDEDMEHMTNHNDATTQENKDDVLVFQDNTDKQNADSSQNLFKSIQDALSDNDYISVSNLQSIESETCENNLESKTESNLIENHDDSPKLDCRFTNHTQMTSHIENKQNYSINEETKLNDTKKGNEDMAQNPSHKGPKEINETPFSEPDSPKKDKFISFNRIFLCFTAIMRDTLNQNANFFSKSNISKIQDSKKNQIKTLEDEVRVISSDSRRISNYLDKIFTTFKSFLDIYSTEEFLIKIKEYYDKFEIFFNIEQHIISIINFVHKLHKERGIIWKVFKPKTFKKHIDLLNKKYFVKNDLPIKKKSWIFIEKYKNSDVMESIGYALFITEVQSHLDVFLFPFKVMKSMSNLLNLKSKFISGKELTIISRIKKTFDDITNNVENLLKTPQIQEINIESMFECLFRHRNDDKTTQGYVILTSNNIYITSISNMVLRTTKYKENDRQTFQKAISKTIYEERLCKLKLGPISRCKSTKNKKLTNFCGSLWNKTDITKFKSNINSIKESNQILKFSLESTESKKFNFEISIIDPIDYKKLECMTKEDSKSFNERSDSTNIDEVFNFALRSQKTLYLDDFWINNVTFGILTVEFMLENPNLRNIFKKESKLEACIVEDSLKFKSPCSLPVTIDLETKDSIDSRYILKSFIIKIDRSINYWIRIASKNHSKRMEYKLPKKSILDNPFFPTIIRKVYSESGEKSKIVMKITAEYQKRKKIKTENSLIINKDTKVGLTNDSEKEKLNNIDNLEYMNEIVDKKSGRHLACLQLAISKIESQPDMKNIYRIDSNDQEKLNKLTNIFMSPSVDSFELFKEFKSKDLTTALPELLVTYPILKFRNRRQFITIKNLLMAENDKKSNDDISSKIKPACSILMKLDDLSIRPTLLLLNHIIFIERYEKLNNMNAEAILTCIASFFYDNDNIQEQSDKSSNLDSRRSTKSHDKRESQSHGLKRKSLSSYRFSLANIAKFNQNYMNAKNNNITNKMVIDADYTLEIQDKVKSIEILKINKAISFCLIKELKKFNLDSEFYEILKKRLIF